MPDIPVNSPLYRAAVVLLALGETSVKVLSHFSPAELEKVYEAMQQVETPDRETAHAILSDFTALLRAPRGIRLHPDEFCNVYLTQAIGSERANTLAERGGQNKVAVTIEPLKHMDARAVAEMFRDEHPQVLAIILTQLDADKAAATLRMLPEPIRAEVMLRVATMDTIPPHGLAALNEVMSRQFDGAETIRASSAGGVKVVANILNLMESGQEDVILGHISDEGGMPKLAEEIRELMFIFENLLDLDDMTIQSILREVANDKLEIALRGAGEPIKQHILRNMSERAAANLVEAMEGRGPLRLSEVEAAQKEILSTVRRMADEGKIFLSVRQEAMV